MPSQTLALFLCLCLDPQAPPPTIAGTGAMTGAVTDAISGRPIAGAVVTLEERQPQSPRATRSYRQVTTAKGRFAFLNLPAGETYFVTSSKPGYLDGRGQDQRPAGCAGAGARRLQRFQRGQGLRRRSEANA
jgi:hypothetical protein